MNESRLCYVDKQWAYFTTAPLELQWGDDWDDAPYEHNSGFPYDDHYVVENGERKRVHHLITKVAWDGPYHPPCESFCNSPWSVKDINSGVVAWLIPDKYCSVIPGAKPIQAGKTLDEFIALIESAGGNVYLQR